MIRCVPRWFSETYDIFGPGFSAVSKSRWMSEQGNVDIDGIRYAISKHGPLSGHWTMSGPDGVVATAQKDNVWTRTIHIECGLGTATLKAASTFGRTMLLSGPGFQARIVPAGWFTRRYKIEGQVPDNLLATFAFWLTGMLERRRRSNG